MEKTYKRSRKRERILEMLRESGTHPTAEWIYSRLKKEFPDLSMGTVYRNLMILGEQGHIHKLEFGGASDRFDANISEHYHFICESCGTITDLDIPVDPDLNTLVNDSTQMTAIRHSIEYYGLCGSCLAED